MMINEDDLEQALVEHGRLEQKQFLNVGEETALVRLAAAINGLLLLRLSESPWFKSEHYGTRAEFDNVPLGSLFEDVDAFDIYDLCRDELGMDEGSWNQISISSTRAWEQVANELTGTAEGYLRQEVKGYPNPDDEINFSWFAEDALSLPERFNRGKDREPDEEIDDGQASAVERAIAHDVVGQYERSDEPMVGDDFEVQVGGRFVPVRIIGRHPGQNGTRYELQRTDTGRKLIKLRELGSDEEMIMNWIDKALVALAFGVALGMLGAACPTPDPGPTPDPPDPQQAPCERACHTLHDLGCPGGADYAKCRVTCEDTEDSGVARFCPENVAAIKSCSELDVAFEACE